jgi:hypothetical protein
VKIQSSSGSPKMFSRLNLLPSPSGKTTPSSAWLQIACYPHCIEPKKSCCCMTNGLAST